MPVPIPINVSVSDIAFGGSAMKILPPMKEIPKDFPNRIKWEKIISDWFFDGLPEGTKIIVKSDIDKNKALSNIKCVLKSFQPKHEHKILGCAYLMSLWFDDIQFPDKK